MDNFDFEDITCRLWLVQNYNSRFPDPRDGTKNFFCNSSIPEKDKHAEIFRDFKSNCPFPVFTDYVFKKDTSNVKFPNDIFDRKKRNGIRNGEEEIIMPGRVIILKRKNIDKVTKYFYIWISQALLDKYLMTDGTDFNVNVHILFHPKAGLAACPPYNDDSIAEKILNSPDRNNTIYKKNQYFEKNYYSIGSRYLFSEKHSVLQHRCALLKKDSTEINSKLESRIDGIPIMLIIPVTGNDIYFSDFNDGQKIKDLAQAVSDTCSTIFQKEKVKKRDTLPNISRIACSFFSYSGHLAAVILKNKSIDLIHEFYLFDTRFDNSNFGEIWSLLKSWKKNSDKKIRIYSAYTSECSSMAQDLRKHAHEEVKAPFASFNNKPDRNGNENYGGLENGYEIYNEDKSVSLVIIPLSNFLDYGSKVPKNPKGFYITDQYRDPQMNGHSWFLERLQTHALFHSGFKR